MQGAEISIKDAWRQLRYEKVTDCGYHAVRKWSRALFPERKTLDPVKDLEKLRTYAKLRRESGTNHLNRNQQEKYNAIKALAQLPDPMTGRDLIDLAEMYRAVSASTIYRNGITSRTIVSREQARDIITRGN